MCPVFFRPQLYNIMWSRLVHIPISTTEKLFPKDRTLTTLLAPGTSKTTCDVAVIGGGIIGTSIARKLKLDHNNMEVLLIEKECSLGKHQSSHNSGVMHCGVFYKPESLKAKFCVEGIELLQTYCNEKEITYNKCGKLIVATEPSEIPLLNELLERGRKNNVKNLKLLNSQCNIQEIATGCRGVKALWCPQTANVNFNDLTHQFSKDFTDAGGTILLNTKIIDIAESDDCERPLSIIPEEGVPIQAKFTITCGGLRSESLTKQTKLLSKHTRKPDQHFISLKVDYHQIESKYCDNLKTNIYPVPDLELPFLGAHFSPKQDGTVLLGPYAVPALKLEGYGIDELSLTYLSKVVTSCGFRNMVIRNFSECVSQASKAICSDIQIKDLQRMLPNFSYQFIEKGPSAVQCQLLNQDGSFVEDFVIDTFSSRGIGRRIINVKFTPSPAATSSMAIAIHVTNEFTKKLEQY